MRNRTGSILVLLLLAVSAIAVSRVHAVELHVGPTQTYTTITAALAAAASADTILVDPGTYVETLTILVSKMNLVLQSVVPQMAVIQGSITVQATGVTIDGFRIETSGSNDGIYLQAGSETVKNNYVIGPLPVPGSGQQAGIKTQGGGNYLIQNNTIMNFRYGMNLDGASTDPASVIDGNHISNAIVTGIILQVGPTGFGNGATITNNVIENSASGMVFGNANYKVSNNIIRNNVGSGIYIWALQLTHDIVIECNLIENNAYGIYLDNDDPNAINNVAHNNNIVGSTKIDVYSSITPVFDATSNWWGSPNGPNKISGNVLYDPWLTGCSTCAELPGNGCPAPAVGGTVMSPSAMRGLLALLPWLLLAVVAVGAGAYAIRKRYAAPFLARIR